MALAEQDHAHRDLHTRLSSKRQSFRTSATSHTPQPEKAVIPHQCDFTHASARKGS
jgi:hypothetical protein